MNYTLRNCGFNDLEFILELKTLGMKWYIEKIYGWDIDVQRQKTIEELNSNMQDMRVVQVDGKDIGITTFSESDDYYQVGLIIIHPDYQNKGIASSIINGYINTARLKNKRIILKTYKENPAQNLYKRLGFKIYKTDSTHIYFDIVGE